MSEGGRSIAGSEDEAALKLISSIDKVDILTGVGLRGDSKRPRGSMRLLGQNDAMRFVLLRLRAARRESLLEFRDRNRQQRAFPAIRERIWRMSACPDQSRPQAHDKRSCA